MTETTNYLAIDLGAESGRAIVGRFDGETLALLEAHRFGNRPVRLPDGLYWDVLDLWSQIHEGIRVAAQEKGLASIGLDTWGVDFALLDHGGNLVGNPMHYRDDRTDGMLEAAFARLSREEIFAQTGIQFMQINTLYQLLAMALADAPALRLAHTLLTIPDLFNYWLTGRQACEFTNATTTQCYDPRRQDWAGSLLDTLGIPQRVFPEVIRPGSLLGPLLPSVAEQVGTAPIPVVAPACHDTGSAVVAVPAEGDGFAWISSGTWSVLGAELPEPIISPQSLAYNFTNEGGVEGTFRFSKNVMGLWLVQECRRTWAAQGRALSYDELAQMAAAASPFVCVVDVDDVDFLKPGDMPARIQAYAARTGQPVPRSEGEIVRCVLEGIALKYRVQLQRLEEMVGRRLAPIHIVGGGTQNRLLSQFTADATGRTVLAGPVEATAMGNILMQMIALGQLASLDQARQVVRASCDVERFEPAGQDPWDEAFGTLHI